MGLEQEITFHTLTQCPLYAGFFMVDNKWTLCYTLGIVDERKNMSKPEFNKDLKCKDCQHAKAAFMARLLRESYFFKCDIPESWNEEKYDPVFGKTTPGYFNSCSVMRGTYQACGPDGKKWSPRDTKLIFLALKNG